MGKIYTSFAKCKAQSKNNWFMNKIGLVKFVLEDKNYEIYFTRKRANKYSIIHCKNNKIEWEQIPVLPLITGRRYGISEPLMNLSPSGACIRIFIVKGKPNGITGLDEGIFRSAHKYDENYINVMSEARFKEF